MKRFTSDFLHILLFIGIVMIFFYRTVSTGKLPVPSDSLVGLYHPWRDYYAREYPRGVPFKNFLATDPVRQQIPWRKIAIDQWKNGSIPWWNPYTFTGTTLAGNIQAGVFYPLNFLFFLFSFPIAWTLLVIAQPLLAGIFLYIYLRNKRLNPLSSLTGALSWSFSGFSVAWLTWGTMLQTALWLPLILLSIEKIFDRKKYWRIILTIALIMQLFAGHAQIALYCLVFAALYWFTRRKTSRNFILPVCVFILVTSVQWIPFLQSVVTSARLTNTEWMNLGFFLPWQHLMQFIVPDFFGNPATLNYWGVWNWAELVGYVGMVPLLFAGIAVFSDYKRAMFWFVWIITALAFVLPTPIAQLPYRIHIPFLSSLQPTRLMMLIDFCLAVLAAIGVDAFMKKPKRAGLVCSAVGLIILSGWVISMQGGEYLFVARRNLLLPSIFFAGGAIALLVGVRWLKFRKISLFLLIVLTTFDLFRFGWKYTPFTDIKYFFPETAVIYYLRNISGQYRVMSLDDRILPPNVSSYFGIESAEGYDPLYNSRYEQFMAAVARGNPDITPPYGFNRILTAKNIDSPILPYLGVNYILSLEDVNRVFLKKIFQEGETRLYLYDRALPRVYLAEDITYAQTPQSVIETMFTLKPAHAAVVEQPLSIVSLPLSSVENAVISSYGNDRIIINTMTINPRLVVILNQYDSHWAAEVDGAPEPIHRTNFAFQSIAVPAGIHVITLYYKVI